VSPVSRAIGVFLSAFMLSACVPGTPPPGNDTSPPASEPVSPTETSPVATARLTDPAHAATATFEGATTADALSSFRVCGEPGTMDLAMMELAFVANWDGDLDVYTIRGDALGLRQFTDNPGADVNPSWSGDGQQLAFVIDALADPRLYVSTADGSGGRVVAPDLEVTTLHVEWSPKGDMVAFRNLEDLYAVDITTGEQTLLTPGPDINPSNPRFSPAGTMLAFKADVPSGSDGLLVVNLDGTGLRELSTTLEDVGRPVWHPALDKILFEGLVSSEGVGLYVASLDGAIEKLPIVPRYGPAEAAWSPDGRMIGYIVPLPVLGSGGEILSKNSLHVATAEGSLDVELVSPPDEPDAELQLHELVWAPDSRHIAYTTVIEGRTDLFVLDICRGVSSVVVEDVDFYSAPSWRPLP